MKKQLIYVLAIMMALGFVMTSCQHEEADLRQFPTEVVSDLGPDIMQGKKCEDEIPQLGCNCFYRIDEAPTDSRWWLWTPNTSCCIGGENDHAVSIYNNCGEIPDNHPAIGEWVPFDCDVTNDKVSFAFASYRDNDCLSLTGAFECGAQPRKIKVSMSCFVGPPIILNGFPPAQVQFTMTSNPNGGGLPPDCFEPETVYKSVTISNTCAASL